MNFTFEVDDIVSIKNREGQYVLVKGFDPIPSGFRVWWADPLINDMSMPSRRVRTYSKDMVRIRRPKEEAELAERAENFKMRKALVQLRKQAEMAEAELRQLRKKGNFCLQTGPINVPPGKWLTEEGIEQVRQALKIKRKDDET